MRYLAIDLGDKRTGVAVGDDVTRLAQPVEVIVTRQREELLRQLGRVIAEHGPGALVLGLPLNMDGSVGPAARKVEAFAKVLRERFQLPVYPFDERLTSFAADQQMRQSGLTHGQKKDRRDALAAATLLGDFLAQQAENKTPPPRHTAAHG